MHLSRRWPVAPADNDQMSKMTFIGIDGIYFADKAPSQGLQGRRARQEISRKRGDRVVPQAPEQARRQGEQQTHETC